MRIYTSDSMPEKVLSKKAEKLARWHDNYVVFVTPEVKQAKWNEKSIVKVSLAEKDGEKWIVIEKGTEL